MSVHPPSFSKHCGDCPIREKALCARCGTDELSALERIKYYRSFEAGQTLIWAGDRMDFVASVVSGVASLSQSMEDGRTQMVGLLLPSDFLGRPGRELAPYSVKAVTPVVMCCFRRGPFEEMMARTPNIEGRLLEMVLDELDAARDWMLLLGRKTAREKIASLLTIFARRAAPPDRRHKISFELPLTREAMADYLGLTLETVSRQISALKREGVIQLEGNRNIVVPAFKRLIDESGDDVDLGMLT